MKLIKLMIAVGLSFSANSFAEESTEQKAAAPAATASLAPTEGQSQTTLTEVAKETKKSNLKLSHNFRLLYGRVDSDNNTGTVANRNRAHLGYKFENWTVGLKPTWTASYNVGEGDSKITANDLILEGSRGFKLNHDWSLTSINRYYLPTSKASRALSTDGFAYAELFLTKPMGTRFTLIVDGVYTKNFENYRTQYTVKNEKLKTSTTSSKPTANKTAGDIVEVSANDRYSITHYVALDYKINQKWGFSQWVGYGNSYGYSNPSQGVNAPRSDLFELYSIASYAANDHVSVDFGLMQGRDSKTRAVKEDFSFMADHETKYYFELGLKL